MAHIRQEFRFRFFSTLSLLNHHLHICNIGDRNDLPSRLYRALSANIKFISDFIICLLGGKKIVSV